MTAGGISIHAVDVASGRPAAGLGVRLVRIEAAGESVIAEGDCGASGLFDHPTVRGEGVEPGRYRAEFEIGAFYAARGQGEAGFLDVARFDFGIRDATQHYHLPLKFTAWGYSLFRGGL